jgi:hypothetical protein
MQRRNEAGFEHNDKQRRKREIKQAKGRVNNAVLSETGGPPRESISVRIRPDLKRQITKLAAKMSAPRDQVYIADLVEEGLLYVIRKYTNNDDDEAEPSA